MPTFIILYNGQVTSSIRGANAPALKAAVQDVVRELGKREGKAAEAKAPLGNDGVGKDGKTSVDSKPASGNYSVTSGARSDWKMSLQG